MVRNSLSRHLSQINNTLAEIMLQFLRYVDVHIQLRSDLSFHIFFFFLSG